MGRLWIKCKWPAGQMVRLYRKITKITKNEKSPEITKHFKIQYKTTNDTI